MQTIEMEIDGGKKTVLVYESMWEYLEHFGATVEDYRLIPHAYEGERIIGSFQPIEDGYFHTSSRDQAEIEGKIYQHVNWGEEGYALIPEADLMTTLWTIYEWMGDRFEGYESLGMIFQTREEAEKEVA